MAVSLAFSTQYTNVTDARRTDVAQWHRPRLCGASRGKDGNSKMSCKTTNFHICFLSSSCPHYWRRWSFQLVFGLSPADQTLQRKTVKRRQNVAQSCWSMTPRIVRTLRSTFVALIRAESLTIEKAYKGSHQA